MVFFPQLIHCETPIHGYVILNRVLSRPVKRNSAAGNGAGALGLQPAWQFFLFLTPRPRRKKPASTSALMQHCKDGAVTQSGELHAPRAAA